MINDSIKAFLILLLVSCASQYPPSGGPADLEGPLYLGSSLIENSDGFYLEIVFNEKLSDESVINSLSIQPDINFNVKVKGDKVFMYSDENFLTSSIYRVSISRLISDEHGNIMDAPEIFIVSMNDKIPDASIEGKIFNSSEDTIYSVSLHECMYPDLIRYTTESSLNNKFYFNHIDPGNYFISATIDDGVVFSDRIIQSEYGFSSKCISLSNNDKVSRSDLLISNPLYRNKIISASFINENVLEIYIDSKKKIFKVFNEPIKNDSILVELKLSNYAEKYDVAFGPIAVNSLIDTIPPTIESCNVEADSITVKFSEPVLFNNDKFVDFYKLQPNIYRASINNSIEFDGNLIYDYANNFLADTTISIDVPPTTNFSHGTLYGKVVGSYKVNYIIKAENNLTSYVKRVRTNSDGTFMLSDMEEGFYTLYAYKDKNPIKLKEYFPGSLDPFLLGAEFVFVGDSIEVRGGWEIGLEDIKFRIQ